MAHQNHNSGVVVVVPPPTPPPTADGEGRDAGEQRFPDATVNMVKSIELFLCHCSGDGRMIQRGSNGDGWWFDFDDRIANFEARYEGHQHGKDGALARGSAARPPLLQQGGRGGGGGGAEAEAMQRPAGTMRQ
jgi:hypothetical protein